MNIKTIYQQQKEALEIFISVLEDQTNCSIKTVNIKPDEQIITNYRMNVQIFVTSVSTFEPRDILAALDLKLLLWQERFCSAGDPILIPYLVN